VTPESIFAFFSSSNFYIDSSTLRAYPPTRLHAPYLYVPCILAPCPASAMRMLTPWVVVGGQGPKGGDPGGQGAARGRTRAARAHGRTRALRALGPFGPLCPLGAKGDRLYATKAMPNGIDNTDERYSVNVSRFPHVWIPYERAFVGIMYFVQKLPICLRPK